MFASPAYLYLLVIVPVLLFALWRYRRNVRQQAARLGDADLVMALRRGRGVRGSSGDWLLAGALVCVIIALARPRLGIAETQIGQRGLQTLVMADVSLSMLAQDVQPSRLDCAKRLLYALADARPSDRFALGVFSGRAYLQLPLTADRTAYRTRVQALSPTLVSDQGTGIADALQVAATAFGGAKDDKGRAVVLLTDGEDHEGGITEAAQALREAGIHFFIVGIGTAAGCNIPDGNGSLLDGQGNAVVTKLHTDVLAELAKQAGGQYWPQDGSSDALRPLLSALDEVEQTDTTLRYAAYSELFPYFLLVALLLLLPLATRFPSLRRRRVAVSVCAALLVFTPSSGQTFSDVKAKQAAEAYRNGDFTAAAEGFAAVVEDEPRNGEAIYNFGVSLLQQGRSEDAARRFREATATASDAATKASAAYNEGCLHWQAAQQADGEQTNKELKAAIEAYKEALRQNPQDEDARYNLALCLQQQQDQQQQQDKQQQQQNQSQQDDSPPQKPNDEQLLNLARNEEERTRQRLEDTPPQTQRRGKFW